MRDIHGLGADRPGSRSAPGREERDMAVTHSVVLYEPTETSAEAKAAAGFTAGYSGRTRQAYTLDLRQFYEWCENHDLQLFEMKRTYIC